MSKKNHRRGDEDNRFKRGQRTGGFITFHGHGDTPLSGKRVGASSSVASESSTGIRRDRAGAKKFIHSRTRFHEDAALKKLIQDNNFLID